MGSLSKGYAYNAGQRDPAKPRVVVYKGERRMERWPQGRYERFVDRDGNVVQPPLVQAGVPPTEDRINRARLIKRTDGFVDHGRCPFHNGLRFDDRFREEFDEMPEAIRHTQCTETKPTMTRGPKGTLVAHDACPHIEWLIKTRMEKAQAERARKRDVKNYAEEQIKLQQQQLEETKRANERMVAAVEAVATKPGRKASTE